MPIAFEINERKSEKLTGRQRSSKTFCCPYCGVHASALAESRIVVPDTGAILYHVFTCPTCQMPVSIGQNGKVLPPSQVLEFEDVQCLPDTIATLYNECRLCYTHESYYATVLLARTMLMYIATDRSAPANKPFVTYINFLEEKQFITPHIKPWVDRLRTLGNHYVHDVTNATKEEAARAVTFIQYLLKTVYELPQMAMEA